MRRAEMFLHLLCRFISILPTTGGANGPRMYVKNRVDRVLRKQENIHFPQPSRRGN